MLNQPKILPSSDAEWKEYYERKSRATGRENVRLRRAIEESLERLTANQNAEGIVDAFLILKRALTPLILRDNALQSHKWSGLQPSKHSTEYVRYCETCGIEDTCEDPLPPCKRVEICETCGAAVDDERLHSIPGNNKELCNHIKVRAGL